MFPLSRKVSTPTNLPSISSSAPPLAPELKLLVDWMIWPPSYRCKPVISPSAIETPAPRVNPIATTGWYKRSAPSSANVTGFPCQAGTERKQRSCSASANCPIAGHLWDCLTTPTLDAPRVTWQLVTSTPGATVIAVPTFRRPCVVGASTLEHRPRNCDVTRGIEGLRLRGHRRPGKSQSQHGDPHQCTRYFSNSPCSSTSGTPNSSRMARMAGWLESINCSI